MAASLLRAPANRVRVGTVPSATPITTLFHSPKKYHLRNWPQTIRGWDKVRLCMYGAWNVAGALTADRLPGRQSAWEIARHSGLEDHWCLRAIQVPQH